MKLIHYFFGIFLIGNITIGFTQNLNTSLQLLQKLPTPSFSINNNGFSEITNPKFYSKEGKIYTINTKNIHFVDFNNDGHKDVIYQDKSPYLSTKLFVNKNNNFIEVWNGAGELATIKNGTKTTIYIVKQATGCDFTNSVTRLIVNTNKVSENIIEHHYKTSIKNINANFKHKKISGIIRTQPIVDNKQKPNPCTNNLETGNQIKIVKNEKVTIIKEQNEWLMVAYKNSNINSSIGWIKIKNNGNNH